MNCDSDFFLVVEQLPESDRAATAVVRNLPFMNVDRSLCWDFKKRGLQDASAEHQTKICVEATHKIERLIGVNVSSDEKLGTIGLAGRLQIVESVARSSIRPSRSCMKKAQQRVQKASQPAQEDSENPMQHIAPVGEALHLLSPNLHPLSQSLWRAALVKHAGYLGLWNVTTNAR